MNNKYCSLEQSFISLAYVFLELLRMLDVHPPQATRRIKL